MRTVLAIAALLVTLSAASAQVAEGYGHHLEPERTPFDIGTPGYDFTDLRIIGTMFKDVFERNVLAHVFVFAHQSPQYAVGIKRVLSEYQVFALRSSKDLSAYATVAQWKRELDPNSDAFIAEESERTWRQRGIEEFQAEYPADYRDVPMTSCEVGIDAPLGAQIVELWRKMLLQTRYTDHSAASTFVITVHGTSFRFSSGGMTGWTPYIAPDSNIELLVGVVARMNQLCRTATPSEAAQLRTEVDSLLTRLQQLN